MEQTSLSQQIWVVYNVFIDLSSSPDYKKDASNHIFAGIDGVSLSAEMIFKAEDLQDTVISTLSVLIIKHL